jgi:hypothetical protein
LCYRDTTELVLEDVMHVTMQNVIYSKMDYCFDVVIHKAKRVTVTNCFVERVKNGGRVKEGKFNAGEGSTGDAGYASYTESSDSELYTEDSEASEASEASEDSNDYDYVGAGANAEADAEGSGESDAEIPAVFQRVLDRPARSGAYVPGTGGITECDSIVETLITSVYDSAEAAIGIALNSISAISRESQRAVNRIPPEVRNKFKINLPGHSNHAAPGPIQAIEENHASPSLFAGATAAVAEQELGSAAAGGLGSTVPSSPRLSPLRSAGAGGLGRIQFNLALV